MRIVCLVIALGSAAAPAYAHHEALFGPQSAAVFSPTLFVSGQVFDKRTGKESVTRRETTVVSSAGVSPVKGRPLSFAIVLPVTFAGGTPDPSEPNAKSRGFEDLVLTTRYRVNTPGLTSALGLDQSYVMGVGGVELPTGTFDHPFGEGAYGQIAAGLLSVEKRPLAAITYAYYHRRGEYHGERDSGNTFAGGGVAYTPIDDEEAGKLLSLQFGISYERTFAAEEQGMPLADSGASGVFAHPGVVFAVGPGVHIFTLVSLPLTQTWKAETDRQRFRLGSGVIWVLKHSGV